jgi:hypothetical protein
MSDIVKMTIGVVAGLLGAGALKIFFDRRKLLNTHESRPKPRKVKQVLQEIEEKEKKRLEEKKKQREEMTLQEKLNEFNRRMKDE